MKKTIQFLFAIFLFGIFFNSYSQDRKVKATFQYGFFRAGDFQKIQPGNSYGMDLSYFLSKHFFLTAHFNYGTNDIYDDTHTNLPDLHRFPDSGNTNATLIQNNVGLLAGYSISLDQYVITGQAGVSQIIEKIDNLPNLLYAPDALFGHIPGNLDYTTVSMAFPVKFSIGVAPLKQLHVGLFAKNIEIGYALGFYMYPDGSWFAGLHHGPQLSISF